MNRNLSVFTGHMNCIGKKSKFSCTAKKICFSFRCNSYGPLIRYMKICFSFRCNSYGPLIRYMKICFSFRCNSYGPLMRCMKICFSFRCNSYGPWTPTKCDSMFKWYDVHIINFCRPHTPVFYFLAQREGHFLAASLLISWCEEHFICPVLWQLYCLSGRSFYAHLSPCLIGSFAFWTQ